MPNPGRAQESSKAPARHDFVLHTYLHLTVKMEKFRFKVPPICGGPIEVAFITTDRFFRWVRHKGFHTPLLDPENA